MDFGSILVLADFSNIKKYFARCLARFVEYQRQISDSPDGAQHAAMKSVSLAFACGRLQGRLKKRQVRTITVWAKEQLRYSDRSMIARRHFRKAIKAAVRFFNRHYNFEAESICNQIAAVLPVSERYDVLDLCIRVSAVDEILSRQQVILLKACSEWLALDSGRFRLMVEKYLPIDAGEGDIEFLLGIDSGMSKEQIQKQLTEEFRKWNGRITNQNPAIRKRADKMIQIITTQRVAYHV